MAGSKTWDGMGSTEITCFGVCKRRASERNVARANDQQVTKMCVKIVNTAPVSAMASILGPFCRLDVASAFGPKRHPQGDNLRVCRDGLQSGHRHENIPGLTRVPYDLRLS